MSYAIQVKDLPKQPVVTVRHHTSFDKLGDTQGASMRSILSSVEPKGAWPTSAPFAVYHNAPFRPDDVDVEFGVVLNDTSAAVGLAGGMHAGELEPGPVAYTIHEGPYAGIGAAYDAVYDWIRKSGHRPAGPPRELYLIGPDQTKNPSEYRTEIEVPIH